MPFSINFRNGRRFLAALLVTITLSGQALAQVPTLTITASDPDASELGLDPGEFTVVRSGGDVSGSLAFFIFLPGNNGSDYEAVTSAPVFAANQTSFVIPIAPIADNMAEGTEVVTISLLPQSTYEIGSPDSASVNIADDPAVLTVVATDSEASELGSDNGELTFTRSGGDITSSLDFFIDEAGTQAQNGVDYVRINSPLRFPANETTLVVPLVPLPDNQAEQTEAAIINIFGQSTYLVGDPGSATVNIADDATVLSVVATDPQASELGPDAGELVFTRTGGDPTAALNFFLNNTGSTAGNGGDYEGVSTFMAFAPNQTTVTIPIIPIVDNQVEGTEVAQFNLAVQPTYVLGDPSSAMVEIIDNAAIVSVIASDAEATEGETDIGELTFSRVGGDTASALDIDINFNGSTASNNIDYTGIGTRFTFPANETSVAVTIVGIADTIEEDTESAIFNLVPRSTYQVGNPESATINIINVADVIFADSFESLIVSKACALSHEKLLRNEHVVDLGDGTVLDLDSNLQWSLCWSGQQPQPDSGGCSGSLQLDDMQNPGDLDLAGYFDWRVPSAAEEADFLAKTCEGKVTIVPIRLVRDY